MLFPFIYVAFLSASILHDFAIISLLARQVAFSFLAWPVYFLAPLPLPHFAVSNSKNAARCCYALSLLTALLFIIDGMRCGLEDDIMSAARSRKASAQNARFPIAVNTWLELAHDAPMISRSKISHAGRAWSPPRCSAFPPAAASFLLAANSAGKFLSLAAASSQLYFCGLRARHRPFRAVCAGTVSPAT